MFIVTLFTRAKSWKQPKCPLIDDQLCSPSHTHNGVLLSHIKEWNTTICNDTDGPREYHTKWSKSKRKRQTLYDMTYMWNIKKYKWIDIQSRNRLIDIDDKLMLTKEKSGVEG